jgi:hypothetical protein
MTLLSNGNLGIGNINPTSKLHVSGTANISGALTGTTANFTTGVTTPFIQGFATDDHTKIRLYANTDANSIGFHNNMNFGAVSGFATTFTVNTDNGGTPNRGWVFRNKAQNLNQGAMSLTSLGIMTVADRIRVGYGENDTGTSSQKLNVNGSANISGPLSVGSANTLQARYIRFQQTTPIVIHLMELEVYGTSGVQLNNSTWTVAMSSVHGSGNYPGSKLIDENFTSDNFAHTATDSIGGFIEVDMKALQTFSNFKLFNRIGYFDRAIGLTVILKDNAGVAINTQLMEDNGNYGLVSGSTRIKNGTATYTFRNGTLLLNVNGSANISGNLIIGNLTGAGTRGIYVLASGLLITTSSDLRLKENFEPINESETHLKLLELVPKTYQWKNRERHGDWREIGLIAQEVKEVLPELIFENSDGMYGVNYDRISALMLLSIKQLQKQIDELNITRNTVVANLQATGSVNITGALSVGSSISMSGTEFYLWNTTSGGVGTSIGRALVHLGSRSKASSVLSINHKIDFGGGTLINGLVNITGQLTAQVASIGNFGLSDMYARFCHTNFKDATDANDGKYALLQDINGRTFINSASGQPINFRNNNNGSDVMTIASSGNVGIGTTSPTEKLDVDGSATFSGQLTAQTAYIGNYTSVTDYFSEFVKKTTIAQFSHTNFKNVSNSYALVQDSVGKTTINSASNANILFTNNNVETARLASNGNFGIGTTSPTEKLDVNGNINVQGNLDILSAGNSHIGSNLPRNYLTNVEGTELRTFNNNTYDTTAKFLPHRIDFLKSIWVKGNISRSSDERLKENIKPLDESETHLKILQLQPKSYQMIDRECGDNTTDVGLIAQQVKPIFPELVYENDDGMMSLFYDKVSVLMLQSIKQLQKQIDELNNENIKMKNEIIELRRDVSPTIPLRPQPTIPLRPEPIIPKPPFPRPQI